MVFKAEADQYAQFKADERYAKWLAYLGVRVIRRVMDNVDKLDQGDPETILLAHHGLEKSGINETLVEMLSEISRQYETGTTPWEIQDKVSAFRPPSLTGRQTQRYALAGIDLDNPSPLLRMAMESDANEAATSVSVPETINAERQSLVDAYRAEFPGPAIMDICWAAEQHYREWARWIKNQLKDGSKPDRALRKVLTSGIDARQLRLGRPKNWK